MRQDLVKKELFSFSLFAVLPAALNRPGQLASTSQRLYRFYQIVLLHSEANLMLELVKEPLTPGPKVEYVTCFRYTNAQNIGARLMERHLTYPSEGHKIISLCYTEGHLKKKSLKQNGVYLKEKFLLHLFWTNDRKRACRFIKQSNFLRKQIDRV